jgi:hypothetical protein
VSAKTVWGALRGMESFSQLVYNVKEHGYQVVPRGHFSTTGACPYR